MSSFNLAKKLLPAKKAWKSFKNTFQSKLQKLKTSKAIKRTKDCCITTLYSIGVFFHCKLYAQVRGSLSRNRRQFYHYHHLRRSSSAIYVDELFPGHASMHGSHHSPLTEPAKAKEMVASSSSGSDNPKVEGKTTDAEKMVQHHQIAASGLKILEKNKALPGQGGETSNAADAWKIPLVPQLRCVDERADEFISRFRQEMKLQREQSLLDFQEMLARGT